MQSTSRARELELMYQARRGHAPQISISDDNHHVTEAIGDLYGDEDDYVPKRDSRPLSFISSPLGDTVETAPPDSVRSSSPRSPLSRTHSNENERTPPLPLQVNGTPKMLSTRSSSFGRENQIHTGPRSPPPPSRTNSDTANQQFPLNDIDYESSPAAVAQELSNLQAIRRMSMDVASDPDLPSFASGFSVPSVAPANFTDDEDPSKLFWVPARLHPELAPKEFKTFIEEKVDKVRRRSGSEDSLSPDSLSRSGSGAGSLRRKKSMLSRQVDGPNNYRDGAERLERKRSMKTQGEMNGGLADLQELEHLVEDPSSMMRRLSIDSVRRSTDSGVEITVGEDMPILAPKPAGQSLKRSTRTNYRRGSLRKGERVPFSRRMAGRQSETDTEESPVSSPTHSKHPDLPTMGLTRIQTEPIHLRPETVENFSRPGRKRSPPKTPPLRKSSEDAPYQQPPTTQPIPEQEPEPEQNKTTPKKSFHSRIASNGRTTAPLPGYTHPSVPQIIETPPPPQEPQRSSSLQLPERSSSREPVQPRPVQPQVQPQAPPIRSPNPPRQSSGRPPMHRTGTPPIKADNRTLDDMASHPSPLPGNQSTRTDALSFIPTFAEDDKKKSDKKSKEKKDADGGSRKTSWGWLLGGEDKEKEKERERKERAEKEAAKVAKYKGAKVQDNTRLDVLQSSIDGGKGRESLVLDRESIKLEEERKKESARKSSGNEGKKEKDGIFSSLFGGGKKKAEKETSHKKGSSMRGLSPEPPPRILKPDIDYNWTRFSIMEERAIYRMAHIKLANPRRELFSQVLLSNFMYSYLAKVQQMHPQMQIGQKSQHRQAQQKKDKDQPEEFSQYQRYQQQQEQAEKQQAPPASQESQVAQDAPEQHDGHGQVRPDSRASQHSQQSQSTHSNTNGNSNGNSYSVASAQNYHGQPSSTPKSKSPQPSQTPYYGDGMFDDESPSEEGKMW